MALQIVGVQGARLTLGEGLWQDSYLFIPGTSDYVTGGYVITNTLLAGFAGGKLQSAWVSGQNSTVSGPPSYLAFPVFALAQVGTGGGGFGGYSQFLFQVNTLTATPTYAQVANGGNLTGCIWEVTVQGY
jgi:hypothetical protein